MNYYIGDLHLFNRNQTDEGRNYDRRPFATVEEMNQYILERWNAKINNGDTVYILGDMAMRGKNSALLALVAQLKGKKILFRGNHDDLSDYRYQRLFEEITDYREIADSFDGKTYKLCLMHYPILMWNGQHRGSILLNRAQKQCCWQHRQHSFLIHARIGFLSAFSARSPCKASCSRH